MRPSKFQLEAAEVLGINPEGLSAEELKLRIESEQRRQRGLKAYLKLVEHLKSLGIQPRARATAKEVEELIVRTLHDRLKQRGIVKDVTIYVPPGTGLSRHGHALVTKGVVNKVADAFVISLRFDNSRPFGFNAFYVLEHAEVNPSGR